MKPDANTSGLPNVWWPKPAAIEVQSNDDGDGRADENRQFFWTLIAAIVVSIFAGIGRHDGN